MSLRLIPTQTIILIANTVVCAILIRLGYSIQVIKLTTSLIFLLRPLVLKLYVDRHYEINRRIQYSEEPIKQKWNGLAQHIAAIVLDGTGSIVLTVLSSLANVIHLWHLQPCYSWCAPDFCVYG